MTTADQPLVRSCGSACARRQSRPFNSSNEFGILETSSLGIASQCVEGARWADPRFLRALVVLGCLSTPSSACVLGLDAVNLRCPWFLDFCDSARVSRLPRLRSCCPWLVVHRWLCPARCSALDPLVSLRSVHHHHFKCRSSWIYCFWTRLVPCLSSTWLAMSPHLLPALSSLTSNLEWMDPIRTHLWADGSDAASGDQMPPPLLARR